MEQKKEYRYVFSQRLAGYLMLKGFKLLRMNVNLDDPKKHVFCFNNNEDVIQAIQDYKNLYR